MPFLFLDPPSTVSGAAREALGMSKLQITRWKIGNVRDDRAAVSIYERFIKNKNTNKKNCHHD